MGSTEPDQKPINLQLGWPTPSLFPTNALAEATQAVLLDSESAAESLVYGPDPGHVSLRSRIASWLSDFYQPRAGQINPARLFVTNGASAALGMLLSRFTSPTYTRTIWMVEPTYFLACASFNDAGFEGRLRGVPEDNEGIDIDFLRRSIQGVEAQAQATGAQKPPSSKAKVFRHIIYVVPTFSNPSGKIMSLRRREQLVRLAREFDACIISDDVYDWLRWPASEAKGNGSVDDKQLPPPPPRLVDIDRALPGGSPWGNAVSNGSFSKIVAPGVRVGWVEGSPLLSADLCKFGAVVSGGSQGHLSSMFVGHLLQSGALEQHIYQALIPVYQQRYYAMMESIKTHLYPLGITVAPLGTCEEDRGDGHLPVVGGFFLFLRFPKDSPPVSKVAEYALSHLGLRIAHGDLMTVRGDADGLIRAKQTFGQGARLCWAWHGEDEIDEGIQRLAIAFQSVVQGPTIS
ncbi:pyridoxal phosphate-dependent transferase [Microdochium trichocladiopsis]|uniref:Pyridoxal phosphate-dependent transferase n=1 Tax=Microdochium trichocladiopsis TaxID=1682393 RepID=A0A9P8YCZ9_9PEZI|nr:pyridoxal phosphate-dependent transferase [Microdochium trichocladiopsis]KAH7039557.1 pyridoxal phosphate-dependent transferase [Microdochium trichocladiopsis]